MRLKFCGVMACLAALALPAIFPPAAARAAESAANSSTALGNPVVLTAAAIEALPLNQRLELLRYKLTPLLLADKGEMQEFIAINNCERNSDVIRRLFSEFDYPGLRDFYLKAQSGILGSVSTRMTIDYIGLVVTLGDYDVKTKTFPILANGVASAVQYNMLPMNSGTEQDAPGQLTCPTNDPNQPLRVAFNTGGGRGFRNYFLQIPMVTINHFPLDPDAARKYVTAMLNRSRDVYFRTVVEITANPPLVDGNRVTFTGDVKSIQVIRNDDGSVLGKIYEKP